MTKTLYLTDLDGTLLDSGARLGGKTAEILNRLLDAGLSFTCVTGRSFATAAPALRGLRLRLPLATCNGAVIVNPTSGQVLHACAIERACLQGLLPKLEACGAAPMVFARRDGESRLAWLPHLATEGVRDYIDRYPIAAHLAPVSRHQELIEGEVCLLTFRDGRQRLDIVEQLVKPEARLTYYYQPCVPGRDECWLEVNRQDGDKAGALRRLKALTGADETVCFGDNLNDLPMFAASDRCYAVAGACAEVRAAATGVIGGNSEDGVARFIARECGL